MGATAGVDGVPSTPTQDLRKVAVAMKIVAGLDLGSESISLWTMDQAGHRLGGGKTDWDEKVWKQWVKKYGAENLEVAFETGPEGYRADWMLKELGVKTYPFHAGHFGEISRSRKKTDKIDAEKICRALRGGALPRRVELPGPGQARLRNLVSEWEQLLKMLRQCEGRVKGLARQWGVKLPGYRSGDRESWWKAAVEAFPERMRGDIRRQERVALGLLQNQLELGEAIGQETKASGQSEQAEQLESIPGIGPTVSKATVAFLGDGARFGSGRKFAAYVGLAPSVEQTGKSEARLGSITRQGPACLRRLLVQAAHAAVQSHLFQASRWYQWFLKLKQRRGYRKAIVALARKLAEFCYAVVRDGRRWDPWPTT